MAVVNQIGIAVVFLVGSVLTACSDKPDYADAEECLNEELKAGATRDVAKEYCRRFIKIENEGSPYQVYRRESGVEFIVINGREVVVETFASSKKTGEVVALVDESWVLVTRSQKE
jgi:hypothetical protein